MKIIIIRFSSLGDLVTLEPTFRAFRLFFKDANITFLTSRIGMELYADCNYFDNYIIQKNFIGTMSELKKNHYDIIINLQCNRPSHWLAFFARKSKLINQSSSLIQKYLHIKPNTKNAQEILIESSLFDTDTLNAYFAEKHPIELPYIKTKHNWSCGKTKQVLLAPGSSERWESKKWGNKHYSELAKLLIQNGYTVILIGSKLEIAVGQEIENENPSVINLIAKTSISELKSALSSIDILICNDSGPAHIAAGVGTNTITIFGSTDKKHCVKYEPKGYLGNHICITPNNISCHPCYKSKCPTKHECMESISVETVFNTIVSMLNKSDNPNALQ